MNEAQQVLEQAKQVAEQLEQQGPREGGSFKLAMFQKRMQNFRWGKRSKQRKFDRACKNFTKAQRREHTKALERAAHRRFEVAVGLRKDTTPIPAEKTDVDAMFSPASSAIPPKPKESE